MKKKCGIALVIMLVLFYGLYHILSHRGVLWNIVNERCGTSLDTRHSCLVIQRKAGFVVLRDLNGPVQTLLIPTIKITGIEDQMLLDPSARNYFYDAWSYRYILNQENRRVIDPKYLSFSVNSLYGRTQDQLHIHASCLKPDVYELISRYRTQIGSAWTTLPEKIFGHTYIAQKIKLNDLKSVQPFQQLKMYAQDRHHQLKNYGLAMVSAERGDIILLATEVNLLEWNFGSAEEIQDTHCIVAK